MAEYQSAQDIVRAYQGRIDQNTDATCEDLFQAEVTMEDKAHMAILLEALVLFHERNKTANNSWRQIGALGNLLNLYGKAYRLMNALWWKPNGDGHEKPVDNAKDIINYAVFVIRELNMHNMRGANHAGE